MEAVAPQFRERLHICGSRAQQGYKERQKIRPRRRDPKFFLLHAIDDCAAGLFRRCGDSAEFDTGVRLLPLL